MIHYVYPLPVNLTPDVEV